MGINALCLKIYMVHYCRRAGLKVFYSSAISKSHKATILEAKDGIIITVSGFINISRTRENGFPPKVCMVFLFLPTFCSWTVTDG